MVKNKKVGTATIIDDLSHDALDLTSSSRARGYQADLSQMTTSELESLALKSASSGQESTERALAMALESREVGVNTARALQQQTEQLDRIGDEIVEVHDVLDKTNTVIEKMSHNKVSRMLRRKQPVGKGLDKVRANRKDLAERDAVKARGLRAIDLDGMGGGGGSRIGDGIGNGDYGDRAELFEAKGVPKKRLGRKDKVEPSPRSTRDVKEDYSQYSNDVASAMRKQDDNLDAMSDVLTDMRVLAGGMCVELEYQGKKIDELQDSAVATSVRTRTQVDRVKRI
jgi:hypothetical protein